MGESNSVRLESHQWDGLEQMTEQGDADNRSEAARRAVNIGLAELGYTIEATQSPLSRAGDVVGWAGGIAALAWIGVTFAYPVELRIPALLALAMSLVGFGIARLAGGGRSSRSLRGLLGGGRA